MERKPPTPFCKAFVACRQIILDQYTGEYTLIAPTHQAVCLTFPTVVHLSIFARCTSAQGIYELELQLQDLEGEVLWRNTFQPPMECHDPLSVGLLILHNQGIYFAQPGKYEFVLLANGEEIVRDVFWARLPNQPAA